MQANIPERPYRLVRLPYFAASSKRASKVGPLKIALLIGFPNLWVGVSSLWVPARTIWLVDFDAALSASPTLLALIELFFSFVLVINSVKGYWTVPCHNFMQISPAPSD